MRPNLPTNHPETQYRRHNNKQWWRRYSHCTTKIKLSAGDHIPSLNTFERNCCWPLEANACKQQACVQPWQEVIFCAVSQSKWQVVGQHSLPTSQLWSGWFQGPELSEELLELGLSIGCLSQMGATRRQSCKARIQSGPARRRQRQVLQDRDRWSETKRALLGWRWGAAAMVVCRKSATLLLQLRKL